MTPHDPLDDYPLPAPHDATRLAIRAAVLQDLHPGKARSLSVRALATVLVSIVAVALAVLSFGLMGLEQALHVMPLALGISAVIAVAGAAVLSFNPRSNPAHRLTKRCALLAVLLLSWTLMLWHRHDPATLEAALTPMALSCGLRGGLGALVATGGLLWIWRRSDPWTPRLSGALLGTAAGLLAGVGISMACSGGPHAGHLLWGHWLLVPLSTIVGALAAPKTLQP